MAALHGNLSSSGGITACVGGTATRAFAVLFPTVALMSRLCEKGHRMGPMFSVWKTSGHRTGLLRLEAQLQDQWNITVFTKSLSPDQTRRISYRLQQFHFNTQFSKRVELPQSSVFLPAHLCFPLFPSHLLPDLQCSLPSLPSETKQTRVKTECLTTPKWKSLLTG